MNMSSGKAFAFLAVAVLAHAGVTLYTHVTGHAPDLVLTQAAVAQTASPGSGQLLGARGIYMMPAQIGPNAFGVYLMDVDSNTICVYRSQPDAPTAGKFKLVASRSFKYDRFLEDFNNESLRPKEVQVLVETQRQRQELHGKDETPTVDQTPKPDPNAPDAPPPSPLSPVGPR